MTTDVISQYYLVANGFGLLTACVSLSLCFLMLWQAPRQRINQLAAAWMASTALAIVVRVVLQADAQFDIFNVRAQFHAITTFMLLLVTVSIFYVMMMLKYLSPWTRNVRVGIGTAFMLLYIVALITFAYEGAQFASLEKITLSPYTGIPMGSPSGDIRPGLAPLVLVMLLASSNFMPFLFAWNKRPNKLIWIAMGLYALTTLIQPTLSNLNGMAAAIVPMGVNVVALFLVGYTILDDLLFNPMRLANVQLQDNNAALERAYASVERQVRDRTHDLRAALDREHQLSEDLERSLALEAQLNELKTHIIRTVSHEFRTPLMAINNSTQLLVKYHDRMTPEKRATQQTRINEAIQRLTTLLDDVVMAGSVGTEHATVKLETSTAQMVFSTIREKIMQELGNPDTLFFECNGCHAETVTTDQRILMHVMRTLISNAMQYSALDQPIFISIDCTETALEICVKDEGIGIDHTDLDKVFDLMYRGNNIEERDGLGIGLHLAQNMVQSLGGTIVAKSSGRGQGSTFIVTLPKAETDQQHTDILQAKLLAI